MSLIVNGLVLTETKVGWEFVSEAALEKFIWENLRELLGLIPLKQQYVCQGEISDILAVDNKDSLVILELKNSEDRYIIQQLTRYYANLLAEQPFQEKVDYSRTVKLIAITPSYHRHNLIDKKHSSLEFYLLKFTILKKEDEFYFVLEDLESKVVKEVLLTYQSPKVPIVNNIPEPPKTLIEWLGACSVKEQTEFLKIRNKILSCSPKMKEMVDKKTIQYGSGKGKLCAEICFHQKSQKPILFLWLPIPKTAMGSSYSEWLNKVGRTRIWSNGQEISHLGHTPEGFGKMKLQKEWDLIPSKREDAPRRVDWIKSHLPIDAEKYVGSTKKQKIDHWTFLSNLAIEKWLAKK